MTMPEPTDSLRLTRLQAERVIELIGQFMPIGEHLSMTTRLENLRKAEARVRDNAFTVLVVGEFNRGKSTLINALLGRKVLPAFATETTATVCEVRFGETPRALLYPVEPPEAEPVEARVDDIERYVAVDEDDPGRPNPYRKVEVYWPTSLCRNGVLLVDSPGLNKSQAHEERTVGYLRAADAIVFVADCQNAWSRSEVGFVKQLPPSIEPFFVFNKVNMIDLDEQDRVRRAIARALAQVRPDGVRRHYFVDAKHALTAAGHDTEVDRSGVGEFVRDLQRFLATERAAVKIGGPARELAEAVREARKQIPVRRGQLTMPLQDLEEKVDAQRGPLADLMERRAAIIRRISEASDDFTRDVQRALRSFLRDTAGHLPAWASTVEVRTKLTMNPIRAKASTEQFATEVAERLQDRIGDAYLAWRDGELAALMNKHVDALGQDLNQDLAAFETGIDRVRTGLLPDSMRLIASHSDEDGSPMVRALAAAGGMLLSGPAGALVGARLGPTQMLKNAIPQIVVGAGILMFTPLGWVAAAAAMATLAIVQVWKGVEGLEGKLKTKVGEELATQLTSGAADRAQQFAEEIAGELNRFRDTIANGLTVRIEEVQSQFDALLNARDQSRDELSRLQVVFDEMEQLLDTLDGETANLLANLRGAVPILADEGNQ